MIFGERLRTIRKRMGLTQESLSCRSDVNPKYISDIERGKRNPSIYILLKLARALDVSPLALITNNIYEFEYGNIIMDSTQSKYDDDTDNNSK